MKRFLLFGNLKDKKTLVIHVCRNVFSFSHIEYFAVILVFFYVRRSKTLKIPVLGNVMLFLHKVFFYMRFSVLVRKKLKNTQKTLLVFFFIYLFFLFLYRVLFKLFSVLVANMHNSTQKIRFL